MSDTADSGSEAQPPEDTGVVGGMIEVPAPNPAPTNGGKETCTHAWANGAARKAVLTGVAAEAIKAYNDGTHV